MIDNESEDTHNVWIVAKNITCIKYRVRTFCIICRCTHNAEFVYIKSWWGNVVLAFICRVELSRAHHQVHFVHLLPLWF